MSRSTLLLFGFLWTFHQSSAILDDIHEAKHDEIRMVKWPNLEDPRNAFYAGLCLFLSLVTWIVCVCHCVDLRWGELADVLLTTENQLSNKPEESSQVSSKDSGLKIALGSRSVVSVTNFDETATDDKSLSKKKSVKVSSPKPKPEKKTQGSKHNKPPSIVPSTQSVSTAPTIKIPQTKERANAQLMPASESECFDMKNEEMNAMPPWDIRHLSLQNPNKTKFREAEPLSAEAVYEAKPIPTSLSTTPEQGSNSTNSIKRSPTVSTAREPHSPRPDPEEQP